MLKFIPENISGRVASGLGAFLIIYGLLMPTLVGPFLGGIQAISFMLLSGIATYILIVKSLFFEKDRSIISWIIFVLITVVLGFWVLFALGEVLIPH